MKTKESQRAWFDQYAGEKKIQVDKGVVVCTISAEFITPKGVVTKVFSSKSYDVESAIFMVRQMAISEAQMQYENAVSTIPFREIRHFRRAAKYLRCKPALTEAQW